MRLVTILERKPILIFSLIVILGLIVLTLFGELLPPYDPLKVDLRSKLQPPIWLTLWARMIWAAMC